jgi:quercetin dioxygenase-like cupin family protein
MMKFWHRVFQLSGLTIVLSSLSLMPAFSAGGANEAASINPEQIKWGDAPPSLPKGAKLAVLQGDPHKPGLYAIRLNLPAGYKLPPHSHTQAEQLTIISGTFYLGSGDKADASATHAIKAGGFHYLPPKAQHYAFTKTPTVVQVAGEGPFDIHYVNPDEDPQKGAKK